MKWECAGLGLLLCTLSACAATPNHVRSQAAVDFGCKPTDTRIVDAAVGVYLVEGCGQQASYKCPELGAECSRLFVRATPKATRSDAALTKLSVEDF